MKFSGFNLIPLCIPVYASYPPLPVAHARLGYHCHAIGFVGRLHANSDRVQLAERTPAFLTPARADAANSLWRAFDSSLAAIAGCTPASARFAALAGSLHRWLRCSSSQWNNHSFSSRLALGAKPCAIFRNRCEKCGLAAALARAIAAPENPVTRPFRDALNVPDHPRPLE